MSHLYDDELRRSLRAIDQDHRAGLPALRTALNRLFGNGPDAPAQAVILGGMSRRSVLRLGGATVLGAAVLAACGGDDDSTSATISPGATPASTTPDSTAAPATTAAAAMSSDIVILRTASSIEELAVAAYQAAIDSGLVTTPAVATAAMLFQSHHREHSALFQAQTKAAGGEAFTMANPAILEAITPAIEALSDEAGVLALALELEMVAAQTYQANVGTFTDPTLNAAIMTVGGVEARHAAVLASVLGQSPVPRGFQVTGKATKPGTGV